MTKADDMELAARLITKVGGKKNEAAAAAGIHYSSFGKLARGQVPMTDVMRRRIEVALESPTSTPTKVKSSALDTPGRIPKRGGSRVKGTYDDPPLIAELVNMFNGRRNRAAAAMGFSTPSIMNTWSQNPEKFDDFAKLRVERALKGEPPPSAVGGDEPDEYKLGLVIGLFPAANFERAIEASEAFSGKMIFKASIRTEWLGVFKMASDKAKLFKRLMARDAIKITCP